MSESHAGLPARPSLEQLRKRAKELLRAARSGDADCRLSLRASKARRVRATAVLADAQFVIAREHGFNRWADLVHAIGDGARGSGLAQPLIRPAEWSVEKQHTLADGQVVSNEDVYRMFVAARAGDLETVRSLVAKAPGLAVVEYNYTPPIHFAVREGHLALVDFLIERGADIAYRSYPFNDSLLEIAEDREHAEVAALLRPQLAHRFALGANTKEIIEAAREGDLRRVQAELARNPEAARRATRPVTPRCITRRSMDTWMWSKRCWPLALIRTPRAATATGRSTSR